MLFCGINYKLIKFIMKMLKTNLKRLSVAFGILFLSTFTGCQTEELSKDEIETVASKSVDGDVVTLAWRGGQIEAVKQGDLYLVGDMIIDGVEIDPDNSQTGLSSVGKAESVGRTDRLWPNNTMYYEISDELSDETISRIAEAMEHWENTTNIKFVKRTNEVGYVDFVEGTCTSAIGYLGRRQLITAGGCGNVGLVIHEIGHAIGFYHEQQRQDRDDFVTINFDNIRDDALIPAFDIQFIGTADLTAEFDFDSIMLYGPFIFADDRNIPVMTRKNGDLWSRNGTHLSEGDIRGAALLYPPSEITFKANNGLFVSSEEGRKSMTVNRSRAGAWEHFELDHLSEGIYTIKTSNGKYVSSEGGRMPITANRDNPGRWEKFTLEHKSSNEYYVKGSNGMYLSSNNGDVTKGLTFDRSNPGRWEVFTIDGL